MPRLNVGDTICCKIKSAVIVSPYKTYDEIKSFVIVATSEHGYYLFIPHYYYLNNCVVADKYRCKSLDIELRYLDENIIYIQENLVVSVESKKDGMTCKICKEFYPYAVANQEDDTLICYSCYQNPYR